MHANVLYFIGCYSTEKGIDELNRQIHLVFKQVAQKRVNHCTIWQTNKSVKICFELIAKHLRSKFDKRAGKATATHILYQMN